MSGGRVFAWSGASPRNVTIGRIVIRLNGDFEQFRERISIDARLISSEVITHYNQTSFDRIHLLTLSLGNIEVAPGSIRVTIELRLPRKPFSIAIATIIGVYTAVAQYPDFKRGLQEMKSDFLPVAKDIGNELQESCGIEATSSDFELENPRLLYKVYMNEARKTLE